jgi:hypothetical protein
MTNPQHQIAEDEKLTSVMFYTSHSLIWGQVLSKQAIRVSTWLLTDMAPSYLKLYDAQHMVIGGAHPLAPVKSSILYLQINNINAYHLMAPSSEPLDYDPDEPNRKMIPTTAYMGYFQFEGFSRMAEFTNMENYLSAAKAEFIPVYNSQMTCPMVPSIKGIQAPMVLVRQKRVEFSAKED